MIITKILDGINNISETIALTTECLNNGKPVAFPTETVYGIGAKIYDENALYKVFQIKKRNIGNPLSAHIASLDDVNYLCNDIPNDFWKIADKLLPGPISIIMPKKPTISELVTGKLESINIRMPDNQIFIELAKSVGQPIAATSANLSGRPSPNTALSVFDDLSGRVDYIIDGGRCKYSIESTVLSMIGEEPILIRPGVIPQQAIEIILGKKILSNDNSIVKVNNSTQSAISNFKCKISYSLSTNDVEKYILKNIEKNILLLVGEYNINAINHNAKILLNQETLFESIRYAEKNKFDEVIVIFDNFVNGIELIKHRLKFAQELK
ncbi:MAG TPA: L-threonylcarbamoyladenylate synthase [Candidatus Kapabacteria bacterium]|nr:L-threonylcarbamoyladenylate synthase [Candidatus Kapabacteria bacterium]